MRSDTSRLPSISVVTPSFNQGRFIRDTVESVLSQNYPKLEYIVIDGGSTDETLSILREYGDRITLVSEADRGQSDAINKGMRMAKGDVLAYLNSDDTYEPSSLWEIAETFNKYPNADFLYGDFNYVNVDGKIVARRHSIDFDYNIFRYDHCFICQPSSFWRRTVIDKIGLFKEDLYYYMDYDFFLRAAAAGSGFHHIRRPLANLRLHAGCKTVSGNVDARRKMLIERHRVLAPYRLDLGFPVPTRIIHQLLKAMFRVKKTFLSLMENGHIDLTSHKRLMSAVHSGDI